MPTFEATEIYPAGANVGPQAELTTQQLHFYLGHQMFDLTQPRPGDNLREELYGVVEDTAGAVNDSNPEAFPDAFTTGCVTAEQGQPRTLLAGGEAGKLALGALGKIRGVTGSLDARVA